MSVLDSIQSVLVKGVLILTIFFIGIIAARASRRVIERATMEAKELGLGRLNFALLLARLAELIIYVITGVLVANELGIVKIASYIILGIIGVIVAGNAVLLIIFAIPNLLARVVVGERKLRVGQKLKSAFGTGRVVRRRLTDLVIRCEKTDQLLIIPYWSLRR